MAETRKEIDANSGPGLVGMWLTRIEMATKRERDWRKEGKATVSRYRAEDRNKSGTRKKRGSEFNILWSNTNTLLPSLYLEAPRPDVRRRFRDEDVVAKAASEVLERALAFTLDQEEFDNAMEAVVEDYALPGRGVGRVRYVPEITSTPLVDDDGNVTGEFDEELTGESVVLDYTDWRNYRVGEGSSRKEMNWESFRHTFTRDQLVGRFGEDGRQVELTYTPDSMDKAQDSLSESQKEFFKMGEVWEIWDREKRKVLWVSPGFKGGPLLNGDAPITLKGFYSTPKPLYAVPTNGTTIPIPEYVMYEDQAVMLDAITTRIDKIIGSLRVRGVYDSSISELGSMLKGGDGTMTPVENWQQLAENGGLSGVTDFLKLNDYVAALQALYQARDQEKAVIFETTGLSDVQRGQTKASETLGAQQLKASFGSQRIQRRQKDVQMFIRDTIRLMAEVIAENFSLDTLKDMTGLDYPMNAEKEQAKQVLQAAQGQQQPQIPPQVLQRAQEAMTKPSWEQIMELLRSDDPRSFRIDIESEVTAESEVQRDKQDVVELVTAISQLWQAGTNGLQGGMVTKGQVDALTLGLVRKFDLGREIEDILDPDSNKKIVEVNPQVQQLTQQLEQAKQIIQKMQQQLEDKKIDLQAKDKINSDKIVSNEKMNEARLEAQGRKNKMDFSIDQQKIEQDEDALQLEADIAGVEFEFRNSEANENKEETSGNGEAE